MAANRIVESISLETKLGKCALKIQAQMRNDKMQQIAEFALQFLTWHVIPAEAYKKGSAFKRDSVWSPELGKHVVEAGGKVLSEFFSDVEMVPSEYVAPDSAEGIIAKLDKLDASQLAKIEAKLAAAKAKQQSKPTDEAVAA